MLNDSDHFVEIRYRCVRPDGTVQQMAGKGLAIEDAVTNQITHSMWVTRAVDNRMQQSSYFSGVVKDESQS